MGLKLSKKGPERLEAPSARYTLINYMVNNNFIRTMVSKHRRRMLVSGYDLDMSYITDRILAMSFPSERMRAVYRNPLWQVKSVLDSRHPGHYKVYNLCIEEAYDPSLFHGRVERFPFDDNHVPPLSMMKLFCESVNSWLSQDNKNIAVIHCMAGKGRTGLMVCALLVYSGIDVEDALQLYANKRTTNNQGVSIPSQRRYVRYWSNTLRFPAYGGVSLPTEVNLPEPCSRELRRIRLYDTVNTNRVYFVVSQLQEVPGQIYHPSIEVVKSCCKPAINGNQRDGSHCYYLSFSEDNAMNSEEKSRPVIQMDTEIPMINQKTCLDCYFDRPIQVKGDIRLTFYQKMIGSRLFYVCFNTAFVRNSLLQFSVNDMDKVGSSGRSICGPSFCLELLFGPANSKFSLLKLEEGDETCSES